AWEEGAVGLVEVGERELVPALVRCEQRRGHELGQQQHAAARSRGVLRDHLHPAGPGVEGCVGGELELRNADRQPRHAPAPCSSDSSARRSYLPVRAFIGSSSTTTTSEGTLYAASARAQPSTTA